MRQVQQFENVCGGVSHIDFSNAREIDARKVILDVLPMFFSVCFIHYTFGAHGMEGMMKSSERERLTFKEKKI